MNVVGLITEYNPFHNGHLYHLEASLVAAQANYSVAVMSGNFIQRGEPALLDKWQRTKMAISAGVDLVLELPTAYATRNAQSFAWGAIGLLDALGIVTHLCFGSEVGQLEQLQELADFLAHEPPAFQTLITKYLNQGQILPKARALALKDFLAENKEGDIHANWLETLRSPNNILGLEYLTALQVRSSDIRPLTITRRHAEYHDLNLNPEAKIASATGIRQHIFTQGAVSPELAPFLPEPSMQVLTHAYQSGSGPVFTEDLAQILLAKLRTTPITQLAEVVDMTEGLENRIRAAADSATSWSQLVSAVKTKRYTWTRIQRLLCHFLLGYTQDMAAAFDAHGGPQYIRVLGFSKKGQTLLGHFKKQTSLPIITHPGPVLHQSKTLSSVAKKMLALDILATDLYALLYPNQSLRMAGRDWRTAPVRL